MNLIGDNCGFCKQLDVSNGLAGHLVDICHLIGSNPGVIFAGRNSLRKVWQLRGAASGETAGLLSG
jgi:hypothetical protein